MDLLSLGSQSRKTGIKPRSNMRKDRYNMEDIDDFFEDESGSDEGGSESDGKGHGNRYISSNKPQGRRSSQWTQTRASEDRDSIIARKINFTDDEADKFDLSPIGNIHRRKSYSLKSPLSEQGSPPGEQYSLEQQDNMLEPEMSYDDLNNNILDELDEGVDFELARVPEETEVSSKSISSLTKNMALGRTTNSKRIRKRTPVVTPAPVVVSIRPSPLPSPPPDGLRRSRRTKIQPLAFWRNERVIYSKSYDDEADPDITLVRDTHNIPLQEIKEIIHVPAPTTSFARGKTSKSTSRRNKTKKSSSVSDSPSNSAKQAPTELDYDYESDPGISGSEWFEDNSLSLPVYESNDSESTKTQPVAFTHNFSKWLEDPPESSGSSIDNYKLATVFKDNSPVAGALFEFPVEGFKSSKNSGNCIYVFHVIKGLLEVNLSNHTFVVTRGCTFQVPRGNTYGIINIGNGNAKVLCVQSMVSE
ncbi:hypothetical protein CANTEDRAFT_93430 [Yamadazyma tenuis ATCC 10573]|uniref:Mif2/CENP-C cupin domain-containing protein n=1 Tax=Candida tenuis (strain ATCC 10573 / BCRC 21748 / CBS 615 / JCM 9827 / NBRC 10315 / NRRL Y-1498 / VKM Y-70) TaxID=590646 RepID=G3B486_CANTC|nr:uncharacterized protein CANTEDRAFT_93430 [Yamadazyma tenuis ATCC 10573]EGV63921.1 hypothetical protein CANTEDRAFT_93430 [Yamadazyma tenuis ATCC 10573]